MSAATWIDTMLMALRAAMLRKGSEWSDKSTAVYAILEVKRLEAARA